MDKTTKYPYFPCSVECPTAEDLNVFFTFLKSKGIPCAIIQKGNGFVLWRAGAEAVNEKNGNPNGRDYEGEIVRAYDEEGIFRKGRV